MFDFYEEYQADSIKARLEANQERIDAAKPKVQAKPDPQPEPVKNKNVMKSVLHPVFPSSSNNIPIIHGTNITSGNTVAVQFHVAGVSYSNEDKTSRQLIISKARVGDYLSIVHDPDNQFDSNALKVTSENGQVGYVPKSVVSELRNKRLIPHHGLVLSKGRSVNGLFGCFVQVQCKPLTIDQASIYENEVQDCREDNDYYGFMEQEREAWAWSEIDRFEYDERDMESDHGFLEDPDYY